MAGGFMGGAAALLFTAGFAASVWNPALRARRRGEIECDRLAGGKLKGAKAAVSSSERMSR